MTKVELSNDEIIFQNQHVRHLTGWLRTSPYKSIGCVIHWIYVYHNLNLAEQIQVGDGRISHLGKRIATFIWDEDKQMPIFSFIPEYNYIQDKQNDYLAKMLIYTDFINKYKFKEEEY